MSSIKKKTNKKTVTITTSERFGLESIVDYSTSTVLFIRGSAKPKGDGGAGGEERMRDRRGRLHRVVAGEAPPLPWPIHGPRHRARPW